MIERRLTFPIWILPTLLLVNACGVGEPASNGDWAGTVDTLSTGAVLVSNPAAGIWEEGQEWSLTEELRIGTAAADGPELFGNVADLAVDSLGRIYVLEAQAREIRVFDRNGEHIRTFGRQGAGPGEFERPSALFWDREGQLWVVDQRNARFSVFDTTGALLTGHRRPGGFMMLPWPGGMDRDGRLYDLGLVPYTDGTLQPGLIRHDSTLQPVDTFFVPPFEGETFTLKDADGTLRAMMPVPFAPTQIWELDPDGYVWSAVTDPYRLYRLNFAGDTVRIVERDFELVPITNQEREEAISELAENMGWVQGPVGQMDFSRIPATKPAFRRGIHIDDQGYLWVRPSAASEQEAHLFDLFDPGGRYLGRVRSEAPIPLYVPFVVHGDHVYTVTHDELEVPYVVRLAIEGRS